jgi:LysR family transcriptional regulator, low CO2-responsive transcriptional regulator
MSRTRLRRYFRHGLLPQLMVFDAVARLGGVTRAAEELHLAQPTVSMQLKELASALDVVLFEQRGRQLHLTAAGHALRETCQELTALLARTDERLAAWRAASTETLRLAAEPAARQVAARLIAEFCTGHPGLQASLHLAERGELLTRFAKGVDDVYLFELEADALPVERRWSVVHSKGRELAACAALFLRDALLLDANGQDANNPAAPAEDAGIGRRD